MASLANNHLSNIAQQGRYGDTELAHVTKQEKNLLESVGGSGTINPRTGLKEYFPWLAVATTMMGAYEARETGKLKESAALSTAEAADEAIKGVTLSEQQLGDSTEMKRELELLKHGKQVEDIGRSTGQQETDVKEQLAESLKRSGLALSGTIQEKASTTSRRISKAFTSGLEGLWGQLGETMAGIEEFYEGEKGRLSMERKRFQREKDLATKQAESWYLGKNV
jgi:hypothetical protein